MQYKEVAGKAEPPGGGCTDHDALKKRRGVGASHCAERGRAARTKPGRWHCHSKIELMSTALMSGKERETGKRPPSSTRQRRRHRTSDLARGRASGPTLLSGIGMYNLGPGSAQQFTTHYAEGTKGLFAHKAFQEQHPVTTQPEHHLEFHVAAPPFRRHPAGQRGRGEGRGVSADHVGVPQGQVYRRRSFSERKEKGLGKRSAQLHGAGHLVAEPRPRPCAGVGRSGQSGNVPGVAPGAGGDRRGPNRVRFSHCHVTSPGARPGHAGATHTFTRTATAFVTPRVLEPNYGAAAQSKAAARNAITRRGGAGTRTRSTRDTVWRHGTTPAGRLLHVLDSSFPDFNKLDFGDRRAQAGWTVGWPAAWAAGFDAVAEPCASWPAIGDPCVALGWIGSPLRTQTQPERAALLVHQSEAFRPHPSAPLRLSRAGESLAPLAPLASLASLTLARLTVLGEPLFKLLLYQSPRLFRAETCGQ